jgi:hypothetical protein
MTLAGGHVGKPVALMLNGPVGGKAKFRRPPYFRTKKLGILGRTTNIADAPWHDPSWTFASHCSARPFCEREPDWYFDMHVPKCFETEAKAWNQGYYTWLKRLQTPIFMQEEWPEIPMAVRYPIERVLQEFRAYFTNHAAYMIALAMQEGVETIGLFGCQYGAETEHSTQRGSLEYWLGRFEQYGGEVVLPVRHNTLLNFPSRLYGYESHDPKTGKLVEEYRPKWLSVPKPDAPGRPERQVQMQLVDMDKADGRTPLATPPKGIDIAWDRSGHTVQA